MKDTLLKLLDSWSNKVHTLTYDDWSEFAAHRVPSTRLWVVLRILYDLFARWLRENTNGLIRQYLPKGSSFDNVTQEKIEDIMDRLNNRPRKTLNTRTPNEVFYKATKIAFMS